MSISIDSVDLPEDLIWTDEYSYSPVKQSVSVAVDGSLIIEAAAQVTGRPITLTGSESSGWIDRQTLEQLRLKQYQPGQAMTLTLNDNSTKTVLFMQPDGIFAAPIVDFNSPESSDFYQIVLKFIDISA